MTYKLYNYLRDVPGLTFAEKSILKDMASISRDDETIQWGLDHLCRSTGCSERTARRLLRRLEEKHVLLPQDQVRGRGHVPFYRFNVGYKSPVESAPVVPPEHIPPPTNGHMTDAYRPYNPYKPEPLTPEQIEARKAKMEAARARIAEKPRPERKLHDRPGRLARERTGMVSGPDSLDGYSGGDETP